MVLQNVHAYSFLCCCCLFFLHLWQNGANEKSSARKEERANSVREKRKRCMNLASCIANVQWCIWIPAIKMYKMWYAMWSVFGVQICAILLQLCIVHANANANVCVCAQFFVIRNSRHLSMCHIHTYTNTWFIGIYAICSDFFLTSNFNASLCVSRIHTHTHMFHSAIPFHWKIWWNKIWMKIELLGCSALTIDAAPFGYEYSDGIKLYKLLCVSTFPAGIHENKIEQLDRGIQMERYSLSI